MAPHDVVHISPFHHLVVRTALTVRHASGMTSVMERSILMLLHNLHPADRTDPHQDPYRHTYSQLHVQPGNEAFSGHGDFD